MQAGIVRPPSHPKINAAAAARQYAEDVIKGKIVAGKLVKLACKRFMRDLKVGEKRGLRFDEDAAQHVVDFFGFLHHSKGEWGGEIFVLAPWEIFVLANLFGWFKADGTRRFREAYIEVARKNGKTTLMAGIGLYMLLMDGEPGAEVYSAATKKDQAKILFDEATRMRQKSTLLSARIQAYRNNLSVMESSSKFEPLSADEDTLDGLNAHCILADELHAHKSRDLYDVLIESTKARRQPLVVAITTAGAGSDRTTICWAQRSLVESILVGNVAVGPATDAIFGFIACIDEADVKNWQDEKNWPKANPNLGVTVKLEGLREAAFKAKEDPTALNNFLRKHLNVWTSAESRWMPPEKWAACNSAGPLVDPVELRLKALEHLKGRMAFGGLDLSSKLDLSAYVVLVPPVDEKSHMERYVQSGQTLERKIVDRAADPKWSIIPYFFVPQERVEERSKRDRIPYDVWVRQGFLYTTPGESIEQDFIRAKINETRSVFELSMVGFDSWNASQMGNWLTQDGVKLVEVRQGFKSMSEPMKEIMAMVLAKKIEHYGNPILTWNMDNVQALIDPAGSIKPDKSESREKIDGVAGLINALYCVQQNPDALSTDSIYSKRGIVFL